MPRPLTRRLLGLATVTSMQALLLGGTAGALAPMEARLGMPGRVACGTAHSRASRAPEAGRGGITAA